ncbi:hypothetical protein E5161_04320 [Cohnella pontilimi]|uniref:Uncharacterized protein n=1 Tax=Cohnella pontilimi TaxID=2564100 RepID=A0A4U0FEA7_9BACL|nr:YlzJ-like family protein [Cohnella pontilimi]TJY43130.1 hypothetical protein E5161_04320 [Cohnella pontilimi]
MTLYTAMPLELVLDGAGQEPGPFVDLSIGGVTMRVLPIAPGLGRIERLLSAPLDYYLKPEYSPGQTIAYGERSIQADYTQTASEYSPYEV